MTKRILESLNFSTGLNKINAILN